MRVSRRFVSHPAVSLIAMFGCLVLSASPAAQGQIRWDNGDGDQLWSNPDNWVVGTIPGAADAATFNNVAGGVLGAVTSIVDQDFTVANLNFVHGSPRISYNHGVQLSAGTTLLMTNGFNVADAGDSTSIVSINVAFTGAADSVLQVGNVGAATAVVNWFNNDDSALNTLTGSVDLSGLTTFNAYTNTFEIGVGHRAMNVIATLAENNFIRATTFWAGNAEGNNDVPVIVRLGETNVIHADEIVISRRKSEGTLEFAAGLSSPSVTIRAADGVGRADLSVAYNNAGGTSVPSTGLVDFTGGSVDALLGTVIVGFKGGTGVGDALGTFTMTTGVLDATSMMLGQGIAATNFDGDATGTFNLSGGTAVVGTITLGDEDGAGAATGIVNFSGGSLRATTVQRGDGTPTSTFNWTNGTLSVDNFNLGLTQNGGGSILAPGTSLSASIGTTNVTGDYVLTAGAWNLDVTGAGTNDVVNVSGLLNLSGSNDVLNVNLLSGVLADQTFIIASYGSLLGEFDLENLAALPGYSVDYNYLGGNQIALVSAVPEPGTWALSLLLGAGVWMHRRRRSA